MSLKKISTVLLICFSQIVLSQQITFIGNVYGFLGERVLLMKKASKNTSFEGPISEVNLSIKYEEEEASFNTVSDITGSYLFSLPKPGTYLVDITCEGYSSVQFTIKYEDAGEKTHFPGTSFILKKGDNSLNHIGVLVISNKGQLSYIIQTTSQKNSSPDVQQSNKTLIEKAVSINNSSKQNLGNLQSYFAFKSPKQKNIIAKTAQPVERLVVSRDSITISLEKSIQSTLSLLLTDSLVSMTEIKSQIEEAKNKLMLMNPNSENYKLLLAQITNAEKQLKVKELLITSQENEINASKKKIIYLSLFGLFAAISIILLLKFLREKKIYTTVLDEKNKSISKINSKLLSSIRYASIIQSSFFKDKNSLKELFPNSFIFNQPKDHLSGDFYWFGYINNHKILVVADCTGHGVPGALLSILGHSLLDDIVLVRGNVLPGKILFELNKAIITAFTNETQVEYGIDITVISIKDGSNELLFSGITNGPYHFTNKKTIRYNVTPKTIGLAITEKDLTDQSITIKKGDCFYLSTDGYCDQFGGTAAKFEKYNLKRMDSLFKEISVSTKFSDAGSELNTGFNNWKGTKEQTDDVLILGFKI